MHRFADIKSMPTVRNNEHESLYRSFHILNLAVEYLERGTPPAVVLEVINFLRERES